MIFEAFASPSKEVVLFFVCFISGDFAILDLTNVMFKCLPERSNQSTIFENYLRKVNILIIYYFLHSDCFDNFLIKQKVGYITFSNMDPLIPSNVAASADPFYVFKEYVMITFYVLGQKKLIFIGTAN
jgi:hypothetical protein